MALNARALFLSLTLTVLTLFGLTACADVLATEPTPTPVPTAAPTAAPTELPRGGNLTIGISADVPELRPWQPRSRSEEQAIALLYNGLTRLNNRLEPVPDLAERWEASPNGEVITFTLRPDVTWHDGRPLGATDVAFTLGALKAISPTTALLADLRRIERVTTPNTTTVVLDLTERYAPIFADLALPILPQHLIEGRDLATLNFWDTPVGTGPFAFDAREPGQSITLTSNKLYFRGPPLLDRVALVVAPDGQVAADALKAGTLSLAELPWAQWRPLDNAGGPLRTGVYAENGYYYLAFNLRKDRLFADVAVRRALAAALNVPQLVADATAGEGLAIGSSAAPGSWADFTPALTTTADLTRASALLDEVGWTASAPDAIRQRGAITLTAQLVVRGDDPRRVRAAELIAQAARTIGIDMQVQPADFATVVRSKYLPPYDFDVILGSWANGAADPAFTDYMVYDPSDFALFHSSQVNQGASDARPVLNITGFKDAAYDNQAAAALQLYDIAARSEAVRLSQQRIADQLPYLFLWADQFGVAVAPNVTTLDGPVNIDTPMYLGNIERWYIQPSS